MKSFAEQLYCRLAKAQFAELWDNYDEYRFNAKERLGITKWIKWQLRRATRMIGFYRLSWILPPNPQAFQQWMNLIPEMEWLIERLSNDASRELLVDLVAYRILGDKGVRLPLGTEAYRRRRKELELLADSRYTIDIGFMGWSLARTNLETFGISGSIYLRDPITLFEIEQYAHHSSGICVEEGDVVIDGGGCYGDTAIYFAHKTGVSGNVHVFEFIPTNLDIMHKNLDMNPELKQRVTIAEMALWEVSGKTVHVKDAGSASRVSMEPKEGYDLRTQTITIDDYVNRAGLAKVDFIKMDIEGAEENAILGAADTIREMRPKLAICLYHSPRDFVRLPRLIDKICPAYQFYIKHATMHHEETVLFAKVS